eukprot:CAMPEP_0115118596 /NCGR_PEP_ID=MMETSP0227-20121206/44588_1 /TAXON_ID=89957 /ORGANISM="Polarella glacialis, Strain CCMP 1383" /LENGTH=450 /DNA_ID=CAMNT_0002519901 /DNA_START=56 /DNA_END=1408 /DNA_ORIENTATION=-
MAGLFILKGCVLLYLVTFAAGFQLTRQAGKALPVAPGSPGGSPIGADAKAKEKPSDTANATGEEKTQDDDVVDDIPASAVNGGPPDQVAKGIVDNLAGGMALPVPDKAVPDKAVPDDKIESGIANVSNVTDKMKDKANDTAADFIGNISGHLKDMFQADNKSAVLPDDVDKLRIQMEEARSQLATAQGLLAGLHQAATSVKEAELAASQAEASKLEAEEKMRGLMNQTIVVSQLAKVALENKDIAENRTDLLVGSAAKAKSAAAEAAKLAEEVDSEDKIYRAKTLEGAKAREKLERIASEVTGDLKVAIRAARNSTYGVEAVKDEAELTTTATTTTASTTTASTTTASTTPAPAKAAGSNSSVIVSIIGAINASGSAISDIANVVNANGKSIADAASVVSGIFGHKAATTTTTTTTTSRAPDAVEDFPSAVSLAGLLLLLVLLLAVVVGR